jgi:hypothetical protein
MLTAKQVAGITSRGRYSPGEAMNEQLIEQLNRIETLLNQLVGQRTVKDWYSTAEVAEILGKADWTVRNWARLRRVNAEKIGFGRGTSEEWRISQEELTRIQNYGLLPTQRPNG